ncbi:hypothetical protein DMENIID0001_132040 [Sergentomyia squamirostris]
MRKSGLFVATPIRVDENAGDSLTRTSIESSDTSNVSLQLTDSLTPSEDSDTTRIYEIETRETRLLRHSVIVSAKKPVGTRTPPSTPTDEGGQQPPVFSIPAFPESSPADQEQEKLHKELKEEEKSDALRKKTVSPNTVKFFALKKPLVFNSTTPTEASVEASVGVNGTTMTTLAAVEKQKEINNNDVLNKMVIEEDVLPTLPSVKKLMSAFSATSSEPEEKKPPSNNRPKTLPLQADQESATKESERKKYSPSNGKASGNPSAMVPGYSITARSLSKQFRDELKHSTNQEDETPPEAKNYTAKEEKSKRHSSPERSPSPVLTPGRLKSNIAFFENLRNKN